VGDLDVMEALAECRREQLGVGITLTGPAIVEQLDSTTVIEPGDRMRVDGLGNLEITVRGMETR